MYKTINGWTKEKMIQHVKDNFKGKSVNLSGLCVYRGRNETKCAAGLFMKDEDYSFAFEHRNIKTLMKEHPEIKDSMPLDSDGMISLQFIHDERVAEDPLPKILNFIEHEVSD